MSSSQENSPTSAPRRISIGWLLLHTGLWVGAWIPGKLKALWLSLLLNFWEWIGVQIGELEHIDQNEEAAFEPKVAHLTYYTTHEMPAILAVVRFSDTDNEDISVVEDRYMNDVGEQQRLEEEVVEALYTGLDVSVMSHFEIEEFPTINALLNGSEL